MAKGDAFAEKTLEDLEKEITCGICQDHYTEPKVLPCLHYYCKQCIFRLALRTSTGKLFSCPECNEEATLPGGGVDQLKTAFFVNCLQSKFTMQRAHGMVEVKCEACTDSEGKADAFCRQCAAFVCIECIKLHKKIKALSSHEITSFGQLKEGKIKGIFLKESPTNKCLVHDEPLIMYCFDCNRLICHHCIVKDHRDHNFKFSEEAAGNIKTKLLGELKPLREVADNLLHAVQKIRTRKVEQEAQGDSVANTIQSSFKELREILDKREKDLLTEARKVVQEKVKKLSIQEKGISLASAEIQSVVEYVDRCVSHYTDNEIMSMHPDMMSQIERKIEVHTKSGRNLEPVEELDIGAHMNATDALQQLCQMQANVVVTLVD